MSPKRVAVLGLFNSGSTVVAGVLHRLGVDMGAPFWRIDQEDSPRNHYEPLDLTLLLRTWWKEPLFNGSVDAAERTRELTTWIRGREARGPGPVGAKHPLLALCAHELVQAWGPEVSVIWCQRPLQESIQRLQARNWFRNHAPRIQQQLWVAIERFMPSHPTVLALPWKDTLADPAGTVSRLAEYLRLDVSEDQLRTAAGFIRPPAKS